MFSHGTRKVVIEDFLRDAQNTPSDMNLLERMCQSGFLPKDTKARALARYQELTDLGRQEPVEEKQQQPPAEVHPHLSDEDFIAQAQNTTKDLAQLSRIADATDVNPAIRQQALKRYNAFRGIDQPVQQPPEQKQAPQEYDFIDHFQNTPEDLEKLKSITKDLDLPYGLRTKAQDRIRNLEFQASKERESTDQATVDNLQNTPEDLEKLKSITKDLDLPYGLRTKAQDRIRNLEFIARQEEKQQPPGQAQPPLSDEAFIEQAQNTPEDLKRLEKIGGNIGNAALALRALNRYQEFDAINKQAKEQIEDDFIAQAQNTPEDLKRLEKIGGTIGHADVALKAMNRYQELDALNKQAKEQIEDDFIAQAQNTPGDLKRLEKIGGNIGNAALALRALNRYQEFEKQNQEKRLRLAGEEIHVAHSDRNRIAQENAQKARDEAIRRIEREAYQKRVFQLMAQPDRVQYRGPVSEETVHPEMLRQYYNLMLQNLANDEAKTRYVPVPRRKSIWDNLMEPFNERSEPSESKSDLSDYSDVPELDDYLDDEDNDH